MLCQRNKDLGLSTFLLYVRPPGGKKEGSLFPCLPCTCLKTLAGVMTLFWRVNHILECNDPDRKQDLKTRKFRQRDSPRLAINHGASGMRSRTYSVWLNHPFSTHIQISLSLKNQNGVIYQFPTQASCQNLAYCLN